MGIDSEGELRRRAIQIDNLMPETQEESMRLLELLNELHDWKYASGPLRRCRHRATCDKFEPLVSDG
jgi:hypothetical protein